MTSDPRAALHSAAICRAARPWSTGHSVLNSTKESSDCAPSRVRAIAARAFNSIRCFNTCTSWSER